MIDLYPIGICLLLEPKSRSVSIWVRSIAVVNEKKGKKLYSSANVVSTAVLIWGTVYTETSIANQT